MLPINWLRLLPYIAVLSAMVGLGLYGKYEHAGKIEAQQQLAQIKQDYATERARAKTEADTRLSIAADVFASQSAKVEAQEAELSKLGITRKQTVKDLNDALSKVNNLDTANKLLWKRTADQDRMRPVESTEIPTNPENECTATSERLRIIEQASIFAVNDYDTCREALDAIYKQFKQPINHTDD